MVSSKCLGSGGAARGIRREAEGVASLPPSTFYARFLGQGASGRRVRSLCPGLAGSLTCPAKGFETPPGRPESPAGGSQGRKRLAGRGQGSCWVGLGPRGLLGITGSDKERLLTEETNGHQSDRLGPLGVFTSGVCLANGSAACCLEGAPEAAGCGSADTRKAVRDVQKPKEPAAPPPYASARPSSSPAVPPPDSLYPEVPPLLPASAPSFPLSLSRAKEKPPLPSSAL